MMININVKLKQQCTNKERKKLLTNENPGNNPKLKELSKFHGERRWRRDWGEGSSRWPAGRWGISFSRGSLRSAPLAYTGIIFSLEITDLQTGHWSERSNHIAIQGQQ